jgi:hypothetical protein
MGRTFDFEDPFYPVPPAAVDANPAVAIRDLLYRVARLEQSLGEQRVQAIADMKEILLELVSLSDDITNIVERWGVATKAQEAALIGSVIALGRKIVATLRHHRVEPIDTIGQPLDPETSDVAGTEANEHVPAGVVLREVQVGYKWPQGLLRRARVIVSSGPAPNAQAEETSGVAQAQGSADEAATDKHTSQTNER